MLAREGRWPQESSMLRQLMEKLMGTAQLGEAALDDDVAKDLLVDAQLHVDFTKRLWAEGEIQLPDVSLQQ
jgi:hypothetical protein